MIIIGLCVFLFFFTFTDYGMYNSVLEVFEFFSLFLIIEIIFMLIINLIYLFFIKKIKDADLKDKSFVLLLIYNFCNPIIGVIYLLKLFVLFAFATFIKTAISHDNISDYYYIYEEQYIIIAIIIFLILLFSDNILKIFKKKNIEK